MKPELDMPKSTEGKTSYDIETTAILYTVSNLKPFDICIILLSTHSAEQCSP